MCNDYLRDTQVHSRFCPYFRNLINSLMCSDCFRHTLVGVLLDTHGGPSAQVLMKYCSYCRQVGKKYQYFFDISSTCNMGYGMWGYHKQTEDRQRGSKFSNATVVIAFNMVHNITCDFIYINLFIYRSSFVE